MKPLKLSETTYRIVYPIAFVVMVSAILIYFIGFCFYSLYPGFSFNPATGSLITVFDSDQADVFKSGDRITAIDGLAIETYQNDLTVSFWDGVSIGDQVSIRLMREGQQQTVSWTIPERTEAEFDDRFLSLWPLALGFLILSFCIFKFIDVGYPLRKIMSLTLLVMAFCVILADGPSGNHLWYSAYLVRIIGWLIIPLSIHIQWLFPTSFTSIPEWVNRIGIPFLYLLSATCLAADLVNFNLMLYQIGMVIAFTIIIFLLGQHYIHQEENRPRISLIFRFGLAALIPTLLIAMGKGFNINLDNHASFAATVGYILLPTGYLFAIWHRTPHRYYWRANRYLAVYIFMILITLLCLSIVDVIEHLQGGIDSLDFISLIVLTGLISSLGFGPFDRFIGKYLIDEPQKVPQVLQSYTHVLEATQDTASISSLMGGLILPSLQIRQSALLEIQSEQVIRVLDMTGVIDAQIPTLEEIQHLMSLKDAVLPPNKLKHMISQKRWIRVLLPLRFDQELIGVWLLGRRDPNDLYEDHIVQALESIAQQTTIAIINHQKSIRLRSLYEANINRHEAERASLARELHDDTLNNLALLQREFKDPNLVGSLYTITYSLRKIIQGLRPEMLSYGLVTALQDLADVLNERMDQPNVEVDLEGDRIALDRNTELHIFRIVQQACENAIQHSRAATIRIEGKIGTNSILLRVVDDGQGFEKESSLDLLALIKENHYGMAGMYERANIIGAKLEVNTERGKGTTISLRWVKSLNN